MQWDEICYWVFIIIVSLIICTLLGTTLSGYNLINEIFQICNY